MLQSPISLLWQYGCEYYNKQNDSILNIDGINNSYYLYLYDQFTDNPEDPDLFGSKSGQVISKLDSIKKVSGIGEIKTITCKFKSANLSGSQLCYLYNQDLIKNIHCSLSKGNWFDKYERDNDSVPIIVSSGMGLRLNDTIEFSFLGRNSNGVKKGIVIGIILF